jgi:mono/diheme cytochrome c family protein
MKGPRLFAVSLFLAASAGMTAAAQEPGVAADVQAGRAVALRVCAVCHIVSAGPQSRPLKRPPATSFRAIANRPDTTAESLLAFLKTRHQSEADYRKMPGLKITGEQSQAVVRYIMSLRKPAA